ncbi:MAG TPA: coproporphyrinogen III oxidase, partial [Flavobacteriaceae bacterium]|nr:coproporphyrinogen III oxidase [Flavobacteriaceae bacterium]
ISIDLIYGIPEMTNERWLANLEKALAYQIPHLSCYALTVEPKTAL